MALTTSELRRVRQELGYHLLTVDAEPYISYTSLFDQIIAPYLTSGAMTTSSTTVAARPTPTAVALTLASATGFSLFDRVIVDVDDLQEVATVRSVSGSVVTLLLTKAHSGSYPVSVEGGDGIIRELINKIRSVKAEMANVAGEGSLKSVDEISFYQTGNATAFGNLANQLKYWREELAAALGIVSLWELRRAGAQTCSVY